MLYILGTIAGLALLCGVGSVMEILLATKSVYDSYDEIPRNEKHKY